MRQTQHIHQSTQHQIETCCTSPSVQMLWCSNTESEANLAARATIQQFRLAYSPLPCSRSYTAMAAMAAPRATMLAAPARGPGCLCSLQSCTWKKAGGEKNEPARAENLHKSPALATGNKTAQHPCAYQGGWEEVREGDTSGGANQRQQGLHIRESQRGAAAVRAAWRGAAVGSAE